MAGARGASGVSSVSTRKGNGSWENQIRGEAWIWRRVGDWPMPGGNSDAPNSARRSRRVSVGSCLVDAGTTHLRRLLSINPLVSHPLPPGGKVHVVPPVVAKFESAGSHGTAVMAITCFHLHWRGPICRPRWPHSDWPSDRRRDCHGTKQKKGDALWRPPVGRSVVPTNLETIYYGKLHHPPPGCVPRFSGRGRCGVDQARRARWILRVRGTGPR